MHTGDARCVARPTGRGGTDGKQRVKLIIVSTAHVTFGFNELYTPYDTSVYLAYSEQAQVGGLSRLGNFGRRGRARTLRRRHSLD